MTARHNAVVNDAERKLPDTTMTRVVTRRHATRRRRPPLQNPDCEASPVHCGPPLRRFERRFLRRHPTTSLDLRRMKAGPQCHERDVRSAATPVRVPVARRHVHHNVRLRYSTSSSTGQPIRRSPLHRKQPQPTAPDFVDRPSVATEIQVVGPQVRCRRHPTTRRNGQAPGDVVPAGVDPSLRWEATREVARCRAMAVVAADPPRRRGTARWHGPILRMPCRAPQI